MIEIAIASFLLQAPAFAQDKSSGCGPGWYVTKQYTWLGITTRTTTNSYVAPFATTSGTSGCQKHTIVQNRRAIEFLDTNRDVLALEAAMGRGGYVDAYAAAVGCPVMAYPLFAKELRANYGAVFAEGIDSKAVLERSQTAVVSAGCAAGA